MKKGKKNNRYVRMVSKDDIEDKKTQCHNYSNRA